MKTFLFSMVTVLAASTFGCASDPNKDVKDARIQEIEAKTDSKDDSAEAQRKQAEHAAEVQRAQSDGLAANQYAGAPASRERAEAENKMTEERKSYQAKARERLQKLDARAAEAKAKIEAARGKAPTDARRQLETVSTQRGLVMTDMDRLATVSNDAWKDATSSLDTKLDDLEKLTDSAVKSADKISKK